MVESISYFLLSFYCLAAENNGCEKNLAILNDSEINSKSLLLKGLHTKYNYYSTCLWMAESDPYGSSILTRAIDFLVTFAAEDSESGCSSGHLYEECLIHRRKTKTLIKKLATVKKNRVPSALIFPLLSKQELLQSFFLCSFSRKEWVRIDSQSYGNAWMHIPGNHSSLIENDCKDACT